MDCAIVMERVLIFRAALSFRHAARATSLSEGGSIAPYCFSAFLAVFLFANVTPVGANCVRPRAFKERPYNHAVLCGENFFLTGDS